MPGRFSRRWGGQGDALDGAVLYARIAFGGAALTWALFAFSAILRGTGDTTTPARAMIFCCIAQIGLSGALTLGWGPFPSIGIAGPATALIICQGAAALYLMIYLLRGAAGTRLRTAPIKWAAIGDIMRVGGIGIINSLTIALTVVTVTGIVGRYGTAALAGYGLGGRLELMLVPIAFGVGAALTAAVGVNVGANQFSRARRIAWSGAGVTFALTGAIGLVVALAPGLWLDRFTTDPSAHAVGVLYLLIVGPFYGLFGAGQTLYFASQGTGIMLAPVAVGLLRFIVVASIGGLALLYSWPLWVVFSAVAAGLATIGIGLALCLRGPAWRPVGPL